MKKSATYDKNANAITWDHFSLNLDTWEVTNKEDTTAIPVLALSVKNKNLHITLLNGNKFKIKNIQNLTSEGLKNIPKIFNEFKTTEDLYLYTPLRF